MASMKLATDLDNSDFVGARNPDDSAWVKFESRKHLNQFKSEQEGHPVYEMRDFVTIQCPGDQLSVLDTFVSESHKMRFPRQWAHFQNTKTNIAVDGWAIDTWPLITAAQAEELKYRKFQTVEQLADAPFTIIQSMGMGYIELQEKAKIAIRSAKDGSFAQQLAAESKRKDEQLAAMQEQINALLAKSEKVDGRKRKPAKQVE